MPNHEPHWADIRPTEDEILFMPPTPNCTYGDCYKEHGVEIYAELHAMEERHERTMRRDAMLRKQRENEDIVKRILAILERKHFKNMSALNPRNMALVQEICREL